MGFFDKAKEAVGLNPSREEILQEEVPEESIFGSVCPKLTFQQRVIGFAACFVVGYMITFSSFKHFVQLMEGNPVPFAATYTIGNILALLASIFLCGPERQLKLMMDDKRKHSALIYVSCIGLTLVVLFIPMERLLKLLLIFLVVMVQLCAGVWYNLSYIPFGRRTFCKCFKSIAGVEDDGTNNVV